MATVDQYRITMEVAGAEQVDKLSEGVKRLGEVILGVGILEFIKGALEMSNQMADLGDATGLTAGYVKAFTESVVGAGGESEKAASMLRKFSQTFEEVKNGSSKAENAFKAVGISIQDLHTLTDKELLGKTMAQLAAMPPSLTRTAEAVAIFGKGITTLDPTKFQEIMSTKDPEALQKALEGTSETMQVLRGDFEKLQTAALEVFTPLIKSFGDMKLSAEGARQIIEVLAALLVGGAFAKATMLVFELIKAYKELQVVTKGEITLQTIMLALSGPAGWAALAVGVAAAGAAYLTLNSVIDSSIDKTKQLQTESGKVKGPPTNAADVNAAYNSTPMFGMNTSVTTMQNNTPWLTASEQAAKIAANELQAMKDKNIAALKYQDIVNATIGMETNLGNIIKADAALDKAATDAKLALQQQITAEEAKGPQKSLEKIAGYRAEMVEIDKNLLKEKERTNAALAMNEQLRQQGVNYKALSSYLNLLTTELTATIDLRNQNELIGMIGDKLKQQTLEYQHQATAVAQINALAQKGAGLLSPTAAATDVGAGQTKGMLAGGAIQDYNLQIIMAKHTAAEIESIRQETIDKIMALDASLTETQVQSLLQEVDATRTAEDMKYEIKKEAMKKEIALRNDSQAGMKQAFEDIARSADPFVVAQKEIMSVFDNMNSAIDNFVKTGKFSFHNFASSVIQDLIAIELKAMATKLMSTAMTAFTSMLGFAGGGDPPVNQPSIVGEKGPEVFIPKTAGTIIPNNQLNNGGGSGVNMGSSAPVTNNYTTYNISALDSKSVAQVFAENRKSMLASVRIAQKELNYSGAI